MYRSADKTVPCPACASQNRTAATRVMGEPDGYAARLSFGFLNPGDRFALATAEFNIKGRVCLDCGHVELCVDVADLERVRASGAALVPR